MSYNNAKTIGNNGEDAVCDFLVRNGYEIIKRNFTIKGGEIDIIALKENTVAFVEVKTRKPDSLVDGESSVTVKKKQLIIRTAEEFINKFGNDENSYRFDVAVVIMDKDKILKMKYYAGAFDASK
ncbi:MAG: YraN family protein [Ruminococcus sp.]|nr:YraN family protein [Ruminococcus sp.]